MKKTLIRTLSTITTFVINPRRASLLLLAIHCLSEIIHHEPLPAGYVRPCVVCRR